MRHLITMVRVLRFEANRRRTFDTFDSFERDVPRRLITEDPFGFMAFVLIPNDPTFQTRSLDAPDVAPQALSIARHRLLIVFATIESLFKDSNGIRTASKKDGPLVHVLRAFRKVDGVSGTKGTNSRTWVEDICDGILEMVMLDDIVEEVKA